MSGEERTQRFHVRLDWTEMHIPSAMEADGVTMHDVGHADQR